MSTPYLLLGLLAGGARHGYELKLAHDARLPFARPRRPGWSGSAWRKLRTS